MSKILCNKSILMQFKSSLTYYTPIILWKCCFYVFIWVEQIWAIGVAQWSAHLHPVLRTQVWCRACCSNFSIYSILSYQIRVLLNILLIYPNTLLSESECLLRPSLPIKWIMIMFAILWLTIINPSHLIKPYKYGTPV